MALTPSQTAIVKSTAPILQQHGETITRTFYANMLAAHPELKNIFSLRNQATGAQQAALAASVLAYAAHIDDLAALAPAVEHIAQRHASLFVRPEQYAIVGEHLVGAFAQVLGDALTPDVAAAWTAAYAQLADVLIGREKQLYADASSRASESGGGGGWDDWRDFVIARREDRVSDAVVSFHLEPKDGRALPPFLPGQYVSLQIPFPELGGLLQSRQYSISKPQEPGKELRGYRITIKREGAGGGAKDVAAVDAKDLAAGHIAGIVGNRLQDEYKVGDTVQLSPPRGEFVFDAAAMASSSPTSPVVLLSAGVGVTPVLCILDAIRACTTTTTTSSNETDNNSSSNGNPQRPVTWVHAARNSHSVCYGQHVRQAAADAHAHITATVFLSTVAATDKKGVDYDYQGRFDLDKLVQDKLLPLDKADADYFVCGPKEWMIKVRSDLFKNGVKPDKVHLELFGTGSV